MLTHIAQKDHKHTEEESGHFIHMMRKKVAGMNPDDVFNMDQMPYSYNSLCTLEKKGENTVHVLASNTDTKQKHW